MIANILGLTISEFHSVPASMLHERKNRGEPGFGHISFYHASLMGSLSDQERSKEYHVAETQSHVGLTWNKVYSFANQLVDTMNYKTYILKKYSRRFLKIQPDHGVDLISQHVKQLKAELV